MQITLITVGRLRDKPLQDLCDRYAKRVRRYARLDVIEVKDAKNSAGKRGVDLEGQRILQCVPAGAAVIAMDEKGKALGSAAVSEWLVGRARQGQPRFAFVIGGADGLSAAVKQRADVILQLSAMTLTHEMARMVLLEQLYRAMTIWRGEPYHRG